MTDRILERAAAELRDRIALESVRIDRLTVGDAVVMVELAGVMTIESSSGEGNARGERTAGLAYRPAGPGPSIPDDVETILGWLGEGTDDTESRVPRAVAVATLNALSVPLVEWRRGDPMELLGSDVGTIATVGLFGPAFRKWNDVDVRVIERRDDVSVPETPANVRVSLFEPAEAEAAMAGADVVFVTGSALLFGGVDRYLSAADPEGAVVLIGATASFVPEAAFAAGVDVLAGASVADREAVREAVRSGDCGTDLHDAGVEKGYAVAPDATGVALKTLDAEGTGTRAQSARDTHS